MSELEEKLNALMSNPQLMQQIAAMAQNFNPGIPETPPVNESEVNIPKIEPQHIQAIAQAVGQNHADKNQEALLHALSPYLSPARINKLERAMRAAKMAGAASVFLNSGGLQMLTGR